MPRRALLATIITSAVGALMGVVLGAIVGRVIAIFGDETVQTSVPMIFCATLGYFVGATSTIKGSLERFGAKRPAPATFVAALVLVVIVGGVSVTGQAGPLVIVAGLLAVAAASAVGVAIGKPDDTPRHGINSPRPPATRPQAEQMAQELLDEASTGRAGPDPSPSAPPRPEPVAEELEDWVPEDEPVEESPPEATQPPRARPVNRAAATTVSRPAPVERAAPAATKPTTTPKRATKASTPGKKATATKATATKTAAKTAAKKNATAKTVAKKAAAKKTPAKKKAR